MAAIHDITEDDWRLLRAIRLRALREAPNAFTSNYGDEAGHDWSCSIPGWCGSRTGGRSRNSSAATGRPSGGSGAQAL